MSVSNLIRWGGLAAMTAGALVVLVNLINLFIIGFSPEAATWFNLLVRPVVAPVGEALLLLGLVGLYLRQPEATGALGLIGSLCAFFGTVLAQSDYVWAGWLANLGFALFGVSILRTRAYSRVAAILLIISAAITGMISPLLGGRALSMLVYIGSAIANLIFNIAIAWLGFNLFTKRGDVAYRTSRER
ncbi:MAG: hypothetical protein JOZ19_06245 [Rubrobacter sp.]|nr:hypothetical protein [Rubrobacter sp.]